MVYHVVNKSIAAFKIFNNDSEFLRMMMAFCYYRESSLKVKLSEF